MKLLLFFTLLVYCAGPAQSIFARFVTSERVEEWKSLNRFHHAFAGPLETLRPNEPLNRQIKGGENQSFTISLATGQYAEVDIEQHGSMLLATLFDPQGAEIIQMDFPAGGHGPIYFSVIAALAGDYRLEVRATNKWANEAKYEVALTTVRGSQVADQLLVDAQSSFAQGQKNLRADRAATAIEFYNRTLPYWQASQNYHWQAVTQYALSQAFRNLGNRPKTEECLDETLRILNLQMAPNDWRLKASALNDLGPIYAAQGQPEKAFSVLNSALDLYVAHRDARGQASALNNLAITHDRAGSISLARELVEKALTLRISENDQPGIINLHNGLGVISDRLGEPEQALEYFKQALNDWNALEQTSADRLRVAAVLNNLAAASDRLGRSDQALAYYDQALDKYEKNNPIRAPTLGNKGDLYSALGNPVKAKECYDEALRLVATSGKPDLDVQATLLMHLGQLYLLEGDVNSALKNLELARDLKPYPAKLAEVLTNLGAALALKGDIQKAMEAYQSALEIQLKLKDQRGQALTLQKRGEAHVLLNEKNEALEDFNRALLFWKAIKDRRGEAATLNGLADVERERGNLAAALEKSDETIRIIEAQRTNISSRQLRTSYFATQENYYELDIDLRMQLAKSENRDDQVAAALEVNEKARARVLLDALGEAGLGRSEFNQSSDPKLAALIEQRLLLLAKLGAKAYARTKLLSDKHTAQQTATIDQDIDNVTEQYDELEARVRSESPRFAALTKPQPAKLREIQQQLDAKTLLLEYALGEKRSYVWVVSADSIQGVELAGRTEIEQAALLVTKAITARNLEVKNESWPEKQLRISKSDAEYSEAAAALTRTVLEPIANLLGEKRLVIVPDGALQLVPFASLPAPVGAIANDSALTEPAVSSKTNAKDRKFLAESHELTSIPSASVLALQRRELANRKPAPSSVAVLADPVYDFDDARVASLTGKGNQHGKQMAKSGKDAKLTPKHKAQNSPAPSSESVTSSSKEPSPLATALRDVGLDSNGRVPRLALSRREAMAITRSVPVSQSFSALDFKASRATAMSPELSKYRIIHFATHGVLDLEHPDLSGIVPSMVDEKGQPQDGYLRLHDIYNLNLPAELVVLSACQTGIGKQIKGEGLIALTRGFMYAGAKSVVASLWKVDDAATAALMAEFYKQMFTNKLRPAAALRMAQIKTSEQKRWRSPYYWAGFFIQGEWN